MALFQSLLHQNDFLRRTAKLDPGAHGARCAYGRPSCSRYQSPEKQWLQAEQGKYHGTRSLHSRSLPQPYTLLYKERSRNNYTLHTPSGQPDGVAQHYHSPFPGVAAMCRLTRDPEFRTFSPRHIPPDIFTPGYSPSLTIPPPFLHGVGLSPFHHHHYHHPPIYSINQSTIKIYKIDSSRSVRVRNTCQCHFSKNSQWVVQGPVSWVGQGQQYGLVVAFLGGEGNCPRGKCLTLANTDTSDKNVSTP